MASIRPCLEPIPGTLESTDTKHSVVDLDENDDYADNDDNTQQEENGLTSTAPDLQKKATPFAKQKLNEVIH